MRLLNSQPQVQWVFARLCQHFEQRQSLPGALDRVIVKIDPKQTQLGLNWQADQKLATLTMPKLVYLGRCLSELLTLDLDQDQKLQLPILFPEVAFSLDLSRNGVMNLATLQEFILYLATMGYTHLYLYLEDTYAIKSQPYQGYLRGRYTQADLQKIDTFANRFGIEVVPCIQTLAHLTQLLKWPQYDVVKEDDDTLLVDQPQTYELIATWLRFFKQTFMSDRIHLGLDEASGIGRGRYLDQHPYASRQTLMLRHIHKVVALCHEIGLRPEMWSDFIYRALDRKQAPGYYALAADLDQDAAQKLPKDVAYSYWDYGEVQEANYRLRLQRHRLFGPHVHFAGAAHIYGNLVPNYGKSWQSLMPALAACQKEKVEQVMLTTWGDDGKETSHWLALPLMQAFSQRCYHEKVTLAEIAQQFDYCVGPELFGACWSLRDFDEIPGVATDNYWMANPGKYLLWQDPLLGYFDGDLERYQSQNQLNLSDYYQELARRLEQWPKQTATIWSLIGRYYQDFALTLARKSDLGLRLSQAYQQQQTAVLAQISQQDLPRLIQSVQQMASTHQKIWRRTYRPFGWEVLESRYATLLSRLQTTQTLVQDYLQRQTPIPELAVHKLPFAPDTKLTQLNVAQYRRIAFTGYN